MATESTTIRPVVKAGDKAAAAERSAKLDQSIFPPGNGKPYWMTEWGFASVAASSAQDRARSVVEMRAYFLHLFQQGCLGGIFWYVWNESDRGSIYRGGGSMEAGRQAIATMPAH
jgi:hypothetical protein